MRPSHRRGTVSFFNSSETSPVAWAKLTKCPGIKSDARVPAAWVGLKGFTQSPSSM